MARKRGRESVGDMVRSLGLVTLFVAGLLLLLPHHKQQPVKVVDYSADLATARRAAVYPVVAPEGLSPRWRATSSRVQVSDRVGEPVAFHLGFVDPADHYAALEESDGDATAFLDSHAGSKLAHLGTVDVGGQPWEQLRDGKGVLSLVRTTGRATVLVGGGAGLAELRELAGALR
ncbi:MAG: DUF4245 domain-containing protein [Actinomycetota bacterium]|nr:DUF4245 domain-containing protein [Actinomycetota bacterium]